MPEDPILPIDDARLEQPSEKIEKVDGAVRTLAERMFSVMEKARGAGLAAIQIGVPKRLIVMDVPDKSGAQHRLALINAEIIESSAETQMEVEGCLSMPDYHIPVERAAWVKVRFTDLDGVEQEVEADGIFAICLQHEIDHTDGKVFIDRVSRLRRHRAKTFFAKMRRQSDVSQAV
jgi:peptide deformylase